MSFDKIEYKLSLFPRRPSTVNDGNQENGSVQVYFKICMSLNVLELTDC